MTTSLPGVSGYTRKDLVRDVARRLGVRVGPLRPIVAAFVQSLADAIAAGRRVELRGLGSFRLVRRPPSTLRWTTVRFRAGRWLRTAVKVAHP